MIDDTIVAIATAPGEGAIGIIRISGAEAIQIADKIFVSPQGKKLSQLPTYSMAYGHIIDPEKGTIVDEVITSVMKGPRSFTAEDVVEVNCHGGNVPVRQCLELLLEQGCRLAEPGEFTKRAFLNGRLDLAQAESVIDVIRSKTDMSLNVALKQLQGNLSQQINDLRSSLLEIVAHIEADIDFPDEEVETMGNAQMLERVSTIILELDKLINSAEGGRILRDGLQVAIIGKPNVGKSSLLNALLRESRAIVTDIPGTTRDIIEEYINIRGIPVKIIDTAGIRETSDIVEKIGVERSRSALNEADLVLMMIDASNYDAEDQEIISQIDNDAVLVVANKMDLVETGHKVLLEDVSWPKVHISVIREQGLLELEDAIVDFVWRAGLGNQDEVLIANTRHKDALKRTRTSLLEGKASIEAGMSGDFVSIDIRGAWQLLGEITGDSVGEDLIDEIFSRFCLGK